MRAKLRKTAGSSRISPKITLATEHIGGQLAVVLERATQVIGDRDEAYRWLGTPVRALDYATPVSLIKTREGEQRVLTVLDRLEHGVL